MNTEEYKAKPNKTIGEHTQDLLDCLQQLQKCEIIKDEELYNLCEKACKYHDYGKANPEFQKRVKSVDKKIPFNEFKEVAHNVLSLYFLNSKDTKVFSSEEEYLKVAFSVAYHHAYCDVRSTIESPEKAEQIRVLLKEFSEETYTITRRMISKINQQKNDLQSILLKGFLHKCDYCASAERNPAEVEIMNDYLIQHLDLLLNDWKKDNIEHPEEIKWNAMQLYCREHSGENIIVVAQTGMGKTEGALHWIGNNKGFFVLPLKTAINAMYDRISEKIIKEEVGHRLAILHSESLEYLLSKRQIEMDLLEYEKASKQLAMPLTITTMDQLFDFVYRYNGYEMKLTTFSYSRIVIDEIQVYDPKLLAILVKGVEMISHIGGKVALITATLPPFIKDMFMSFGFQYREFLDEKNSKRHNIKVIEDEICVDDIVKLYQRNKEKENPNKILVICNTIKIAQRIFEELIVTLPEEKDRIHLFHSRFTKEDRRKLETKIKVTGRTYDTEDSSKLDKKNEIWVTTSLVEVSLDIDFDYLFTELQDLSSLFQRMGRCNRKGKKPTNKVNCYIYTEIDRNLLKKKEGRRTRGFIDREIYQISKDALNTKNGFSGIVTESQKLNLLNLFFTTEKIKNSDYYREYIAYLKELQDNEIYEVNLNDVCLRDIQSKEVIPENLYLKNRDSYSEVIRELLNTKDLLHRKVLLQRIEKDIVSIPGYEYYMDIKKRKEELKLYPGKSISIMQCHYDDRMGYARMDKNSQDALATFW